MASKQKVLEKLNLLLEGIHSPDAPRAKVAESLVDELVSIPMTTPEIDVVVHKLTKLLEDRNTAVAHWIPSVLGEFAGLATSALPALAKAHERLPDSGIPAAIAKIKEG